jgi:TRAP-type C4-dicarboxylate transport system substrate-binding protein
VKINLFFIKRRTKMLKKKKLTICIILAMTLVLAACSNDSGNQPANGGATASTGETFEFIINHVIPLDDPIHLSWLRFAEMLEERSEGRIQVTIFGNRAISNSDLEAAESVRQGISHMTSAPPSTAAALGNVAGFRVFDFPYIFETLDDLYLYLDSDLFMKISNELEAATGVRALPGYSLGWVNVMTMTEPVNNLADMSGLRIRTMPADVQMGIISAVGASPTPIAWGELFTAVQQGVVDGFITSTNLMVSERFYEICNYLLNWQILANAHIPQVNVAWLDSLPPDLREIWEDAFVEFVAYARARLAQNEYDALERMRAAGVTIVDLDDNLRAQFRAATASVFYDFEDEAGPGTLAAALALVGR